LFQKFIMDYSKKKVVELRQLCKEKNITNYSSLKKDALIKLLEIRNTAQVILKNEDETKKILDTIEKEEDEINNLNAQFETSVVINNNNLQITIDRIQTNQYYIGDNLDLIKKIENEIVDLIYFDPPYNTGRNFYDFNDKFKSKEDYIKFITDRVVECHRVLKKTGTLIIHIEPKISHYFRFICDSIFGENNFKNEIVWKTGGNSKNKYQLHRFHDILIVYAKSQQQTFNPIYFGYDDEYKNKNNVKFCEIYKKEYVTTALHNSQPDVNPRPNLRYEWNGNNKQWYITIDKMKQLHDENRLVYNKDGIPRIKRFLDEMEGVPLRDIWFDINNIQMGEKMDYATQKPIKLLERVVQLYSNENDLCLDIFAGSGTLGRACQNLKRNYILFDINEKGKQIFKSKK
jgi:DNA modification methylase